MTPSAIEALMWAGITPPKEGRKRTTCPKCSPTRKKAWEKCLLIREDAPGITKVYCHHCRYEDYLT
jgi:hypothetical protein